MTTIPNIYAHIPPDSKQRVQATIPIPLYSSLFLTKLPKRGTQDRIITLFLRWLDHKTSNLSSSDHELVEQEIMKLLKPFIDLDHE